MNDDTFRKKYGICKTELKSKRIVLHCLKGKRAIDAADKLALLGYDDVYIYKVCIDTAFCIIKTNRKTVLRTKLL